MILGGTHLKRQFALGTWKAYENNKLMVGTSLIRLIGANSIDLTLSPNLLMMDPFHMGPIDLYTEKGIVWRHKKIGSDGFAIQPGHFYLGSTEQRFETLAPITIDKRAWYFTQEVHGRSTIGRIGLAIHITAGYGDYGFQGTWTLELKNLTSHPIIVYPHIRICQLEFHAVFEPIMYEGMYSGEDHYEAAPMIPILGRDRFE
jgi:dCTP deaminase